MNRTEIENWLDHHRESMHQPTRVLLDQCEIDVQHHARELAWRHAREILEASLRRFRRGFGLPASEDFVARELCHEIARELRHHEPHPSHPLEQSEWLSARTLAAVDPEARAIVGEWLEDLADREEHEAWKQIVSFTDHFATTLIRRGRLTRDLSWDFERSYPKLATSIGRMIMREFEDHLASEVLRAGPDTRLH